MKGKIAFVLGAAVGYVLGARAGRQRYEQIASAASKVWESPGIQRQVQQAQDFAARKVGEVPGMLVDTAKKAMSSGRSSGPDRADSSGGGGGSRSGSGSTGSDDAGTSGSGSSGPASRGSRSSASGRASSGGTRTSASTRTRTSASVAREASTPEEAADESEPGEDK